MTERNKPMHRAMILFKAPLTKQQLTEITAQAKAGKYTQLEYFQFVLDNYDAVERLMDNAASRTALKAFRPLMRISIGRK